MQIKIILCLLIITQGVSADDYSKLAEIKKNKKIEDTISQNKIKKVENKLIKIEFKDIESFDQVYWQTTYNLKLQECIISSRICIFKYGGSQNINTVISQIKKQEVNIESVKRYIQYKFKAY